jgi:hypothetical protein
MPVVENNREATMFDSASGELTAQGDAMATRNQNSDWQAAHDALVRLARTRAGLDFEEGRWLLAAQRARVHDRLGYGSFLEYVARLFGYAPRLTQDKLRVAEALETLPQLAQALRDGKASWSCARELTRVATTDTERAWLERARGRTVREVEKLVAGHRPGSMPDDAAEPSRQRHVLRFEVSGEVWRPFARPWPRYGATPASRWTTIRRCCCSPGTCWRVRSTTAERAAKWSSPCASTANELRRPRRANRSR